MKLKYNFELNFRSCSTKNHRPYGEAAEKIAQHFGAITLALGHFEKMHVDMETRLREGL